MTSQVAQVHKVLSEKQTIYKLVPPFESTDWNGTPQVHEFVVASKAHAWNPSAPPGKTSFAAGFLGGNPHELLVFPSNGETIGELVEIGGSYECPGGDAEALGDMGYSIEEKA